MKTNPLLAALVGVLFLCAVGTILLATRYFFALVDLERLQSQTNEARTTVNYAQSLANDSLRYSETHPDINPVLDQFRRKATGNTVPFGPPDTQP